MKTLAARKPYRNLFLAILLAIGLVAVPVSAAGARPAAGVEGRSGLVASILELLVDAWDWFGGFAGEEKDGGAGAGGVLPSPPGGGGNSVNGGDCAGHSDPDGCPG